MKERLRGFVEIIIIIIVIIFLALGGFYLLRDIKYNSIGENLVQPTGKSINNPPPTPTPFPFQELTIPYLRGRNYESSLGDLKKFSENEDYAAYLTTYDSDGLRINGLLTIPNDPKPEDGFPAVVFVHGYIPPDNYKTSVNYGSYVDLLGRGGLVVFKIDLRGHGTSEGEAGGAYYSGDYVIDTLNAHAALKSSDFVNPEKIGLWGHSMAGNIVFRSFVVSSQIPATVIWAGAGYTYKDLREYMIQDTSYRPPPVNSERARKRQELRNLYGDFDPKSDFWEMVPATNYLQGVSGALQIHHAVNDNVVSIDYSRNLMRVLDSTGISHELKEYPTGGHNLSGSVFNSAMQQTIVFFKNNLH